MIRILALTAAAALLLAEMVIGASASIGKSVQARPHGGHTV